MMTLKMGAVTALAALWACVLCGCGSDAPEYADQLVPVTGTITRDGKPLADAQVFFTPTGGEGQAADGVTDQSGKYTLTTPKAGPGVLPGQYNVSVSKFVKPDGSPVPPDVMPADVGAVESIPPRYSTYGQSQLTATVPEGGGTLDFKVDGR